VSTKSLNEYPIGIEAMMLWEKDYGDIPDPPMLFDGPGPGVSRKMGGKVR
jgi:hypothetical protein